MPLAAINTLKEQAATFRPTLLVDITFATGLVLRLASISCTYGGNSYLGRLAEQSIDRLQALSEQGIDRVPGVSLTIADPDAVIWTNYERVAGFKGATIQARFVFHDPLNATEFSSDSIVVFNGICNQPRFEEGVLVVRAQNKANLQRVQMPNFPIQRRCANVNPRTVAQRAEASNEDSMFYFCGETRDLTTAPPCQYTRQTCTQPNRFSGSTWQPPQGGRSREYTTGQWIDIRNSANEAKYGDFYPLVYGTAWVEPPVLNVVGDGNYTRGECVVMAGEAQQVLRVIVNDTELSPATAMDGTPYFTVNKDFRFHILNAGDRDGSSNLDVPYSGQGDPYGNLVAIYWVVPRRVAETTSTPNIKVLLQGAKVRVYSDPTTFTKIYSDNPMWVLCDLLTKTKYTWADIDIPSVIAAAAILDASVTYTNQFGNASASEKRGSCSIVLRQRRSLADITRGIRLAFGIQEIPNSDGKLSFRLKGTLAEQQPSPVAGSNFNTAIPSKNRAGGGVNGYVAYSFDASSIVKRNGRSTLVRLDRDINDLPNRVAFQFADSDYGYAASSFVLVDSDDIARAGQEVSGGLVTEPIGINSYNAANRMAKQILDEHLRGNPLGNTNGTDFWAWETSVKGLRLKLGQIIRVSDTRAGLSNALMRITAIQPSRDFQTLRIEAHAHNDDWYLDSNGQAADPLATGRRRDLLARPAFPWRPNTQQPISGDAYFPATDLNFGLRSSVETSADGTPITKLRILGQLPVNEFANLRPPILGTQGTTATSGGNIPGGGRAYHFVVCARDATGKLSAPSLPCTVIITNAGANNTATIPVVGWDASQSGWDVFGGEEPNAMSWQASGTGTTPASITITEIRPRQYGVPDIEFDRLLIRLKRIKHSGIVGTAVSAVSGTTITIGGTWTANELAGYEVSLLAKQDLSAVPIANYSITANTTNGVLTVTGTPNTQISVGDVVVVRSKPSVSGSTITDPKWENHFGPTGLEPNGLVGFVLRVIAGTGRGRTYTIASNTSTSITLVTAPEMDGTSRYIVEEPVWLPDQADSASLNNDDYQRTATFEVPTGNYQQQTLLVQGMTLDGAENEAFEPLAPVREIYVFGAPQVEDVAAVTANYAVGELDRVISVDSSSGAVTVTLPAPAEVTGQRFAIKRKTGANTVSVVPAAGSIDGAGSVALSSIGDYVEVVSDGSRYLQATTAAGGGGGGGSLIWTTITYAATITPNAANKNERVTLTGPCTINFPSGAADGAEYDLVIIQDGTGERLVTFGAGWPISANDLSATANAKNFIRIKFTSASAAYLVSLNIQ